MKPLICLILFTSFCFGQIGKRIKIFADSDPNWEVKTTIHNVYFMGNSLTQEGTYPNKIGELLGPNRGIVNKGIATQGTAQMLARFVSDVSSHPDCEYVVIMGGVNDMGAITYAVTIENNLQQMYNLSHNAGIKVVGVTVTPFNGGFGTFHKAVKDSVNSWILSTAQNVDFRIDSFKPLESRPGSDSLAGIYDRGDHIHLSTAGYELLGTTVFNGVNWNDVLPINLTNFSARQDNDYILLNWETATELNNAGFTVERSADVKSTWSVMGFVKGSGNSNTKSNYKFKEKILSAGKCNYRLGQVDLDGEIKYSPVVSVEIKVPNQFTIMQNYPNPFNPSTVIKYVLPFDSRVTLEVYNITGERIGRLINEEQSAGYYSVDFNPFSITGSISSGVYFYRLTASNKATGNNFSSIKKMILMK